MITSEKIDIIIPAMTRAWGRFPAITRNAIGSVFKEGKHQYDWKYATYDHILDQIKPHLAEEGLMIAGGFEYPEGEPGFFMGQYLWHGESQQKYGHRIRLKESELPQAFGSQLTYKMRYGLQVLFQVAAADDDDGNAAQGQQQQRKDNKPSQSTKPPVQNAKPAGGQGSSPPATAPASGSRRQPAPPANDAGAARLAPPPEKGAISKRIAESKSLEDLNSFVHGLVGYQPIAQNPGLWPRIMAAVRARLDKGFDQEQWAGGDCDACEDAMNVIWPAVASSAIKSIATPQALTRWMDALRVDYYEAEHEQLRNAGQLRAMMIEVVNRAAQAQTEQGWDPKACMVLAESVSKCKEVHLKLEAQEKESNGNSQQSSTDEGHPAEEPQEPEASL